MKSATSLDKPAIDLNVIVFDGVSNGFLVIGTWWWNPEERDYEQCLVICDPNRPVRRGQTTPCIIPISSAWKWAMHAGTGDPMHIARMAHKWFKSGALPGNHNNKKDTTRLWMAVESRLKDLVLMPPKPEGELIKIADVGFLDPITGKLIEEVEVTHNVH